MNTYVSFTLPLVLTILMISGCSLFPASPTVSKDPEILTIYPDGTMRLMGRPVAAEDIVIYPDGFGGERAAIKVRLDPLRPDFYRDTIIVQRIDPEDSDN
jgi:hypothetical protein